MKIKLPCGKTTIIDKKDQYLIKLFPYWRCNRGRVVITRYIQNEYGAVRQDVHLGRAIVKPPKGYCVDHKNSDPLDNRRENLRLATHSQNSKNRVKMKNKTSKYHGVSRVNSVNTSKPWRVFIRTPDGSRVTKSFAIEEEAAKFYDMKSKEIWGEFTKLNFE